jgi:DNA-directed RNA polymerase specialized sigma24 family protein
MLKTGRQERSIEEPEKGDSPRQAPSAVARRATPVERNFTEAPDRDLVEAVRRKSEAALIEYYRRFRPLLLREAKGLGVQPALRAELVDDCLADVALRLLRHTMATPRMIAPYLVRALRLQRLEYHRTQTRRRELEESGTVGSAAPAHPGSPIGAPRGPNEPRADAAMLSEATRRAGLGPDGMFASLSPTLQRLAQLLDEGLTDDERLLLVWVGNWVPQSEIAAWLGITHGAVRNRVMRLRERVKRIAIRAALKFSESEQAELRSFFRRAGLVSSRTSVVPSRDLVTAPRPPNAPRAAARETDESPGESHWRPPQISAGRSDGLRSEESTER